VHAVQRQERAHQLVAAQPRPQLGVERARLLDVEQRAPERGAVERGQPHHQLVDALPGQRRQRRAHVAEQLLDARRVLPRVILLRRGRLRRLRLRAWLRAHLCLVSKLKGECSSSITRPPA
jgi:hypothetical protein